MTGVSPLSAARRFELPRELADRCMGAMKARGAEGAELSRLECQSLRGRKDGVLQAGICP